MLRVISSTVARSAPRRVAGASRGFAAHAGQTEQLVLGGKANKDWIDYRKNLEHHAAETTELWRRISFFVAVPATLLGAVWAYRTEHEHTEHEAHIMAEHGGHLPPPPDYSYLNRRPKPFPWGMNSLFFNPRTQKNLEAEAEA